MDIIAAPIMRAVLGGAKETLFEIEATLICHVGHMLFVAVCIRHSSKQLSSAKYCSVIDSTKGFPDIC
jgi:hypothetical protein